MDIAVLGNRSKNSCSVVGLDGSGKTDWGFPEKA